MTYKTLQSTHLSNLYSNVLIPKIISLNTNTFKHLVIFFKAFSLALTISLGQMHMHLLVFT